MPESLVTVSYLVAGVLFIMSLGGLSAQESARRGNGYGIAGMLIAIAVTAAGHYQNFGALAGAVAVGALIGAVLATRVAMTSMPQLVAILHSFVGLAAVLVGFGSYLSPHRYATQAEAVIHDLEVFIGVFVAALTFTGSIVAWGKLQGVIRSKPLLLPGRHWLNLVLVIVCVVLGVEFVQAHGELALSSLLVMAGLAALLGVHLVMAIGGADMPVVVSMLNSYSGWA